MKEKDIVRKQRRRKILKKMKQKKRAKIVIRNLAFKITEDNLKEHFSQYGEIEEIKILTKPDGKPTGVAFLQFNLVQSAAKAIHHANMKPLLDRAMVVDWAVPKNKFSQNGADVKSEMKTESIDENEHYISEVKIDNDEIESDLDAEADSKEVTMESRKADDESDDEEAEIKDESEDTDNDESKNNGEDEKDDEPDEEEVEIKDESEDTDNDERNNDDEANDDDDDDDDDDDKDNINITINQSIKEEKDEYNRSNTKHPRRISNDVSEGKTVFLKNLPFSVKNDELKEYMKQFGPVDYALVCIDPLTEYSRGTAFVKFQHVQDAEKCLASNELRLRDQIIEVHRALHRNEVLNKKSLKEQRIKDTRNLYLIKEGVVLAGSPAAVSVSVSDMEKRLKLEQWKSQMLRNLNMFVSRVRLAVHNLPPDLDDAKLRQICKNHSGPKAVIKEARVMRDLKNVDATGKGKSKEYGFVAFTTHEDALKALRSLNNNPNIFSKTRRPILGFSIENRILVNAKERRIQKSRDRNPLWSGNNNKRKREDAKEEKVPIKRLKARKSDNSDEKPYAGITGNLGQDRLRSNYNLKSQAQLHMQTVKKQKKVNKMTKELKTLKKEKAKRRQENMPVKQKKKFDEDDANFNKLLNNYRSKLKGINLKKSKWYESTSQS
ncbi:RNA-binding protein [Ooceraea biroi]|uniref:RNA-binding protein n=1 Tax=Ooceraea biroi TaxID=2015173 RepID=A0A026WWC7_OOCBI|nr:RNA-binding protein [Ooceraea biroi]